MPVIWLGGYKCLACHSEPEDTNFEASMQVKTEGENGFRNLCSDCPYMCALVPLTVLEPGGKLNATRSSSPPASTSPAPGMRCMHQETSGSKELCARDLKTVTHH